MHSVDIQNKIVKVGVFDFISNRGRKEVRGAIKLSNAACMHVTKEQVSVEYQTTTDSHSTDE